MPLRREPSSGLGSGIALNQAVNRALDGCSTDSSFSRLRSLWIGCRGTRLSRTCPTDGARYEASFSNTKQTRRECQVLVRMTPCRFPASPPSISREDATAALADGRRLREQDEGT